VFAMFSRFTIINYLTIVLGVVIHLMTRPSTTNYIGLLDAVRIAFIIQFSLDFLPLIIRVHKLVLVI
jgi:hypothetical protein